MQRQQAQQQPQQLSVFHMPNKVIILGSGMSVNNYKYTEGDTVWCPFSMYSPDIDEKINLYFGMHSNDSNRHKNMIELNNYPLDEIRKKFNCNYFTNTISYMLAYALYKGFDEIEIYGVDMNDKDEYINQRSSVMYWIGFARGKGVKVKISSNIDNPVFLYGYDNDKKKVLTDKIKSFINHAETEKKQSHNETQKNQYTGFIHALKVIINEI